MIKNNFHEKITLFLSFFILNNYLFLSLNFSEKALLLMRPSASKYFLTLTNFSIPI